MRKDVHLAVETDGTSTAWSIMSGPTEFGESAVHMSVVFVVMPEPFTKLRPMRVTIDSVRAEQGQQYSFTGLIDRSALEQQGVCGTFDAKKGTGTMTVATR